MELHIPFLLSVLPLNPASSPVYLHPSRVNGYGDGLVRLLQRLVGVGVQRQAALPEARVVARRELGYELVEAEAKSLKLAVGHPVEGPYGIECRLGSACRDGPPPPVHRLKLLPVVIHEAEFEDELSSSNEAFVDFSPVGGHVDTINVNAK